VNPKEFTAADLDSPWPPAASGYLVRREAACKELVLSGWAPIIHKYMHNMVTIIHDIMALFEPAVTKSNPTLSALRSSAVASKRTAAGSSIALVDSRRSGPHRLERNLSLAILWSPLMVLLNTKIDNCSVKLSSITSASLYVAFIAWPY
jgi:hypothetical protein